MFHKDKDTTSHKLTVLTGFTFVKLLLLRVHEVLFDC